MGESQSARSGFNPSCFSHPLSADGFTLSHAATVFASSGLITAKPAAVFQPFWRATWHAIGDEHLDPGWHEDITVDRLAPRQRLLAALDEGSARSWIRRTISTPLRANCLYWRGELHGWLQ